MLAGLRCLWVVIAMVVLQSSCECNVASKDSPMAPLGPEEWWIEGVKYDINRTYYLRDGRYNVIYVMEYELATSVGNRMEDMMSIAFPLMAFAYKSGVYERTKFQTLRGSEIAHVEIAVDLFDKDNPKTRHIRILKNIGDIVAMLQNDRLNHGGD